LNVMLPPKPGALPIKPPAEGEEGPLRIADLTVDQITRWNGEVIPNEKGIVLRERLFVPPGSGKVTVTIRATVTGLPKVVLNAKLMAQLPPAQEMRPRLGVTPEAPEGVTPEPFLPGSMIDPKEYSGRQNWLGSRRIVAEESGTERVMFAHALLCEGSTYLLDIFVDPHKGPDKLEGGTWVLEMFGSGEVEIGVDTMEQDLEVLVRESWVGPVAELAKGEVAEPPRSERAAKTRKQWMRKRGLLPADDEEEAEAEAPAAKAAAKPEAKAKPKAKGKEVEAEPEVDMEQQEAEWLASALERAGVNHHSNITVGDFVNVHTIVDPTLTEEDPYTIAPVLNDISDPESPNIVAIKGLGMKGVAEVQQGELEATIAKWEKIQEEVTTAKERNAQALVELTKWSEDSALVECKFTELRETLRGGLGLRYQAKQALKDLLGDAEKTDLAELQTVLEEANLQEVGVWDAELVENGSEKKAFMEDFGALRDRLSRLEAEPLADQESRDALSKLSASVSQRQKLLKQKKLPLPPDMLEKELLQQAADAIAAAVTAAEGGE